MSGIIRISLLVACGMIGIMLIAAASYPDSASSARFFMVLVAIVTILVGIVIFRRTAPKERSGQSLEEYRDKTINVGGPQPPQNKRINLDE